MTGMPQDDRPEDDWPPIISAAHRPAWIVWRDVAITLVMWALLLFLLKREARLAWREFQIFVGQPVAIVEAGVEGMLERIMRTALIILFLIAVLGAASLFSRRRRDTARGEPVPVPVPDRDLARDLGLDEQQLNHIRGLKIVALDVDEQLRVTVRPDWRSSPRDAGG